MIKMNALLQRKPRTVSIKKLRKNKQACSGITQAHGLQWKSSDLLFRTFKKMCSKAELRNVGFFQVNFLATNRTLSYLMPSLKLMKNVSNDTKIEVILAENYRVTNSVLIKLAKAIRYLKRLRNFAVDVERYEDYFACKGNKNDLDVIKFQIKESFIFLKDYLP